MGVVAGQTRTRTGRGRRWALALLLLLGASAAGAWYVRGRATGASPADAARLDLLYSAFNEFNARNFARASAILDERASQVDPTPLDWMLRARIAEAEGRLEAALEHLAHIPDSDEIGAQARLKAGQVELARHHSRAAEAAYRRALELDPTLIQAHRELAYLYALQRREPECDAQFRALAAIAPLDHILAFAWSQNNCRIWDPKGPREPLSRFVAEDPDDRPSRLALASSYYLTNDLDLADSTLRPLPDSDPDALALRVELAIHRGQIAEAEALARDGPADHPRLNALRGKLAMYRRDPAGSATSYRAALRLAPDDRDATHGLGVALRQLGDPQADAFLERASLQDQLKRAIVDSVTTIRTDPQLFTRLAQLCDALGRRPEARAWYQLAIGRDPFDKAAQRGLAALDGAPPSNPSPHDSRPTVDAEPPTPPEP